jgi:hypothetical protein
MYVCLGNLEDVLQEENHGSQGSLSRRQFVQCAVILPAILQRIVGRYRTCRTLFLVLTISMIDWFSQRHILRDRRPGTTASPAC